MGIARIYTKRIKVDTKGEHIESGKCGDPRKCMERLAIWDALEAVGIRPKKLRVDAGHIRAIWGGYRWVADTPRKAHNALVQWDDDLAHGRPISVRPHSYTLTFRRTSKVRKTAPFTPERRAQINAARRAREEALGTTDRKRYSRVIGHTYI